MITYGDPVYDGAESRITVKTLFPNPEKPLKAEIGFGSGTFILKKAQIEPDVNFVGIELYHKGIRALAEKIKKDNIKNLIIIHSEAKILLNKSIKKDDLSELFINFPDPWPKKRHKKRRLVNIDFANLVFSKLKNSGRVYIATDSENYAREMLIPFEGIRGFKNLAGRLKFSEKIYHHNLSKYEKKFLSYGKKIYYLLFQANKLALEPNS